MRWKSNISKSVCLFEWKTKADFITQTHSIFIFVSPIQIPCNFLILNFTLKIIQSSSFSCTFYEAKEVIITSFVQMNSLLSLRLLLKCAKDLLTTQFNYYYYFHTCFFGKLTRTHLTKRNIVASCNIYGFLSIVLYILWYQVFGKHQLLPKQTIKFSFKKPALI